MTGQKDSQREMAQGLERALREPKAQRYGTRLECMEDGAGGEAC